MLATPIRRDSTFTTFTSNNRCRKKKLPTPTPQRRCTYNLSSGEGSKMLKELMVNMQTWYLGLARGDSFKRMTTFTN
jgi:hypothetical protein